MKQVVRDRDAMVAGMNPILRDGRYVFCTTAESAIAKAAVPECVAFFREEEGDTLVLPIETAVAYGFDTAMPMAWISLHVFSALDGVGLTAAIAPALADAGIACNVIAAFHHDHLFVPCDQSWDALEILRKLQQSVAAQPDTGT